MKNVTISMDDELARWLRIEAAKHDTSMSGFVSNILRNLMESERGYARAMRRNLGRKPQDISSGKPYPSREETHDRSRVR